MDFGRVTDPARVDFRLPRPTGVTSSELAPPTHPRVRLGTARWTHPEIVAQLGAKRASLEAYARQFDAVELNSTFYGVDPTRLRTWRDAVPSRFRFVPKVPQEISHVRQLEQCGRPMEKFQEAARELGDQLGPVALQMAPHFPRSHERRLLDFLERHARDTEIAVELRHESWFENDADVMRTRERLAGVGAIWTITDVAGRRDVLHMTRAKSDTVVVRFGGVPAFDSARVDEWASQLSAWSRDGTTSVYFFLHRPEEEKVVELGATAARAFRAAGMEDCRVPAVVKGMEQGELF